MTGMPKMYDELAPWWPLLSSPADYEEEASYWAGVLKRHCGPPCSSLLELGSGGGNNDGRALRYLEWSWDPDPSDTTYVADYAFLVREADGSTRVLKDRHLEGLFAEAEWLRLLTAAGFDARALRYRHSEVEHEIVSFLGIAR
jgi:hypothetical protein